MKPNYIVLSETSSDEEYKELFTKPVGYVFKAEGDYEAVLQTIEYFTPEDLDFEVFPCNPGTHLYSQYGPDHLVVTKNQKKQ